ncbi:hypothetical protein Vadar_020347 [Vaccinium darrowii]|uniref:Uncharacterized protein n=1 Tax=Vaccinium darrowii TaxID=229202 RepID=A0ACB7XRV9_9ERIC|nr:hypothetical protein Vadar_020347 [Vaccinium darrowii]
MRLAEQNAQLLELQGRRPHTSLAKQFIDLGAKEFSGTIDPTEAENWLKDAVRILNRMGVANDDKVDLVTFMFKGEALHWWEATERLLTMPVPGVVPVVPQRITWARFEKAFDEQYFPESYKYEKENEFTDLRQGRMSVTEYEAKFTELSRYAAQLIPDEAARCRRFQRGLNFNIRKELTGQGVITNYAELVHRAKMIEKDVMEEEEMKERFKKQRFSGQSGGSFGTGTTRSGGQRPQNSRGQSFHSQNRGTRSGGNQFNRSTSGGNTNGNRGGNQTCFRCGAVGHFIRDCPQLDNKVICYKCGQPGHIATNCGQQTTTVVSSVGSAKNTGVGPSGSTQGGSRGLAGRPATNGRVFAMSRQDAQATPEVVAVRADLFSGLKSLRVSLAVGACGSLLATLTLRPTLNDRIREAQNSDSNMAKIKAETVEDRGFSSWSFVRYLDELDVGLAGVGCDITNSFSSSSSFPSPPSSTTTTTRSSGSGATRDGYNTGDTYSMSFMYRRSSRVQVRLSKITQLSGRGGSGGGVDLIGWWGHGMKRRRRTRVIWGIVGVERVVLDGGGERDDGELGRMGAPRSPWKAVFLSSEKKRKEVLVVHGKGLVSVQRQCSGC